MHGRINGIHMRRFSLVAQGGSAGASGGAEDKIAGSIYYKEHILRTSAVDGAQGILSPTC
jgi:hypothetical protein